MPSQHPITTAAESPDHFAAAKSHAAQIQKYSRIIISAPVALGAELLRLKALIDPKKGRPDKIATQLLLSDDTTPEGGERIGWRELMTRETGLSYEWCRRCMIAAERVIERLSTSKDAHPKAAAKLLQSPPAEWSDDDYAGLADTVGAVFDADTFNSLLIEIGVIRDKTANLIGGGGEGSDKSTGKKLSAKEDAQNYWRAYYRALATDRADETSFRKRLRYLPIQSDDPRVETSLADLEAELQAHHQIVKSEILRRA